MHFLVYLILTFFSSVTSQIFPPYPNLTQSPFKNIQAECKPTVVLTRCNVNFDDQDPNWIWSRQTEYPIIAQIEKGCSSSSLLTAWSVDFRDFPGNSKPFPEFDNKPQFIVKYFMFGTGAYVLELKVTEVDHHSKYEVDAKCLIKIKEEDPKPVIIGGSYRKVTSDTDFVVQGNTSINMNTPSWVPAFLYYRWSCTVTPPNNFCPTDSQDNNLYVPSHFAQTNTRYDFTLAVSADGGRWLTTRQVIDVQRDSVHVSIICMKNCDKKINHRRIIYLQAKCDECFDFENNIEWSLDAMSSNSKPTIDFDSETVNGAKSTKLVIKENVLKVKDFYRFRVKYQGGKGESAQDITIAPTPIPGVCKIDPTQGQSLVTQFKVTCSGFSHYDPITYNLYNKELKTLLSVSNDGKFEYFYLSDAGTQILRVEVIDTDGIFNDVLIQVSVSPATNDIKKLIEIHEGKAPPKESVKLLLSQGKVPRAIQLINAIAIEMKSAKKSEEKLQLQKMLLEDLKSIDLLTYEEVQQVATTLKTINVEFDRCFTKSSNELASKVSSSHLGRVHWSSQPALLETQTTDLAEILLDVTTANFDKQQEDLKVEDDPFDLTTLASYIDVPVITENYPNYDDADLDYMSKRLDYENITNNKIETARLVDLAVGFTMAPGQPPWKYSDHTVLVDEAVLLSKESIGTTDKFAKGHEATANYNNMVAFGMVTNSKESPFWWKNNDIDSSASVLTTNYYIKELGISNFESPMEIVFKINLALYETRQSVTVPHSGVLTPDEMELSMSVHRVDVEKEAPLIVTFKADKNLEVVIKYNRRPNYHDFKNSVTVTKADNKLVSLFPHSMLKYGDAWVYVAVLPEKGSSGQGEITVEYNVSFQSPKCLSWDQSKYAWFGKTCHVGLDTTAETLHCFCYKSGQYSFLMSNATFKNEKLFRIPIDTAVVASYVIPFSIFVIFAIYCLALCFGVTKMRNARNPNIYYLCDNLVDDLYGYSIIIKTGDEASAGTTSNISLKLFGTKGSCKAHVVNYPDPEKKLLQSGNEDWFVLSCSRHLGDLTHIYLWHDSVGLRESWHCDWVIIRDLQTNQEWYFDVQHSFSVLEGEQNYVKVELMEKRDGKGCLIWCKKFLTYYKRNHTWNLCREYPENDLTYLEQVTIILSSILCTLFFAILINGGPHLQMCDGFGPGHYYFSNRVYWIAFFSSFFSFAINLFFTIMFRMKLELVMFNFTYSFLAWILIITMIVICLTYFMVFGPWVPYITGWLIITLCMLELLKSIILVEGFYMILKLKFCAKSKTPNQSIENSKLIKQSNDQRIHLHSTFGKSLLQNYIGEKYRPLTKEEWKVKREKELLRVQIAQQLQDLVMFLIYLMVLYFIVFSNRDYLNVYSNIRMKELVYGLQTRTNLFEEVHTIPQFLQFINKTIIPVTNPTNWYGEYNLRDPGNLADFNTKILGVVRVRQLRVKTNCSVPKRTKSLNLSCLPEFTNKNSDVRSCSEYWKQNNPILVPRLGDTWSYLHEASPTLGYMTVYPGGGYSSPLGRTLHNSLYDLRYINQTSWLDEKTRAVFVEFLSYNPNYNIFHFVKLTLEVSSSGWFAKSSVIFTSRLFFVNYEYKIMIFVAFVAFLGTLFVMAFKHIYGAAFKWKLFIRDVWNYVDFFIIITSVVCIFLFLYRSTLVGDFLARLARARHNEIVSYYHLYFFEELLILIAAILICVATIRLWKLIRFGTVFQVMEKTIVLGAPSLLAIMFFHLLIIFAYSIIGNLIFGAHLDYFRSFDHALSSSVLLALNLHSHFDFDHLEEFEGFGYIYYITYSITTLVMTTLYIAVITMSFQESSADFSNRKLYYTVAKYVKDVSKYRKELFKKRLRQTGGSDENIQIKVTPKADEHRYADSVVVPKFKLHCMSQIAKSMLLNKFKTKRDNMSDYKMSLMRKIIFYNFTKDKLKEPKEMSFICKEEDGNVKFVPDGRILEMEFVANYIVNEGTRENSKVEYFDKVKLVKIKEEIVEKVEDVDKFEYIEETLKSLVKIIDNIKLVEVE